MLVPRILMRAAEFGQSFFHGFLQNIKANVVLIIPERPDFSPT